MSSLVPAAAKPGRVTLLAAIVALVVGVVVALAPQPASGEQADSSSAIALQALDEGFDDIEALADDGWERINTSDPTGTTEWFQGNPAVFGAHEGDPSAYIAANYNNAGADPGTISNWLLTPTLEMADGAELSFWTRTTDDPAADRLEVRASFAGESADVGDGAEEVGDFDVLLETVNENLDPTGYPEEWTEVTVTLADVPDDTVGRIGLRYAVPDAGPFGENGDYIGIDTLSYVPADPPVDPELVSVEVSPAEVSVALGGTVELTATAVFDDDSTADVTGEAAWTSSDEAVATVDAGTVSGVAEGEVEVTAEFGGESDAASVTVTDGEDPPPEEPGPGPEGLVRISAPPGRVEVAIAASQDRFDDGEADAVVLARADEYPDALAGTPLAADRDAPLLITSSNELLGNVAEEIARVLGDDGDVYLLGGTVALEEQVEQAVAELGYDTSRLAGQTRFETAQEIAGALDDVGSVLLTTGLDFPDALTAGAAASANDGVVLLTAGEETHPTIDAYLDGFDGDVWAIGGPATRAYPGAEGVLGATRDETAVAVAEAFFDEPSTFGVARRDDFPDALAGGAHIAAYGGPLVLSYTDQVPDETAAWVVEVPVTGGFVYGGTSAVSEEVFDQLEDLAFDDDDG